MAAPIHAGSTQHSREKPVEVREALFRIALASPDASCRAIADRFNLDYRSSGLSVGKTYVSDFLRDFRQWRASPMRHSHTIDTAGAVNQVWAIDLTEHRIEHQTRQPLLGILDHSSRRMLTLDALRERTAINILRLLRDAIEHYGKPKAIRTDNEAMFTSWIFAFALQWLGIRHQRTLPHSPWMNGRVERVWSTFKQVLRICQVPTEAELQATLILLRNAYNQQRPHQSLSGHAGRGVADPHRAEAQAEAARPPPATIVGGDNVARTVGQTLSATALDPSQENCNRPPFLAQFTVGPTTSGPASSGVRCRNFTEIACRKPRGRPCGQRTAHLGRAEKHHPWLASTAARWPADRQRAVRDSEIRLLAAAKRLSRCFADSGHHNSPLEDS